MNTSPHNVGLWFYIFLHNGKEVVRGHDGNREDGLNGFKDA
jgi:hypothetical protein